MQPRDAGYLHLLAAWQGSIIGQKCSCAAPEKKSSPSGTQQPSTVEKPCEGKWVPWV